MLLVPLLPELHVVAAFATDIVALIPCVGQEQISHPSRQYKDSQAGETISPSTGPGLSSHIHTS